MKMKLLVTTDVNLQKSQAESPRFQSWDECRSYPGCLPFGPVPILSVRQGMSVQKRSSGMWKPRRPDHRKETDADAYFEITATYHS